jgi:hypothetical protein
MKMGENLFLKGFRNKGADGGSGNVDRKGKIRRNGNGSDFEGRGIVKGLKGGIGLLCCGHVSIGKGNRGKGWGNSGRNGNL